MRPLALLWIFGSFAGCVETGAGRGGIPDPPAQVSELWGRSGELWSPRSRLPDFSFAGYHFGDDPIPDIPVRATVTDFGAKGDGVSDDTEAFLRAIASTSEGAVRIPAGRYVITQVLKLTRSGVVLRGAGRDATVLYFPKPLVDMIGPSPEWAGSNTAKGRWSWGGGVLWCEGRDAGVHLTDVTGPASRGDTALTLSSAAGLAAGKTIRLVQHDPPDDSLRRHLHAEQSP